MCLAEIIKIVTSQLVFTVGNIKIVVFWNVMMIVWYPSTKLHSITSQKAVVLTCIYSVHG